MKHLLTLIILAVALAGCGGDDDAFKPATLPPQDDRWLDHQTKAVEIDLDGTPMLCIERGGSSHGGYSGLTCDWYGWHLKKGDVPNG